QRGRDQVGQQRAHGDRLPTGPAGAGELGVVPEAAAGGVDGVDLGPGDRLGLTEGRWVGDDDPGHGAPDRPLRGVLVHGERLDQRHVRNLPRWRHWNRSRRRWRASAIRWSSMWLTTRTRTRL